MCGGYSSRLQASNSKSFSKQTPRLQASNSKTHNGFSSSFTSYCCTKGPDSDSTTG